MDADNEIARSIGRLEGKVDLLIDMHKDTRKRLLSVEKRSWLWAGAVGVITILYQKTGLSAFL